MGKKTTLGELTWHAQEIRHKDTGVARPHRPEKKIGQVRLFIEKAPR
jgi:hypothetical protein